MANFTQAIAKAQSFGLKAYTSKDQLVVTNKSGRVVGRVNADKAIAYKASGYSEMEDIAEMVGVVEAPKVIQGTVSSAPVTSTQADSKKLGRRWVKNQGWVYETGNYGMDVLSGYYEE